MIKLRDYQEEIAGKAANLLRTLRIAYLSMEVRTGKTFTALHAASVYGATRVLFVTKKKAIGSIQKDYNTLTPAYVMHIINYESLHKVEGVYDLIIVDEAHSLGAFPKPSLRAKELKKIADNLPVLYLSGTPSPESYSQLYHQFWISSFTPFFAHKKFYDWAKSYVNVKQVVRNGFKVNDYKDAKEEIISLVTDKYFLSYTQEQAGFEQRVKEEIIRVAMSNELKAALKALRKDKVYTLEDGDILGDTPAKLLIKMHQLSSGTVKLEDGKALILDDSKAHTIRRFFEGQKIAIFYCFDAEKDMLKKFFPKWTDNPEVFQESTDATFLGQFQSAREGVRLDTADALVFFNLQHSFLSYEQARNRLISKEREKEAKLYFIFSDCGIEQLIYKAVTDKKNFTASYYKRHEKQLDND